MTAHHETLAAIDEFLKNGPDVIRTRARVGDLHRQDLVGVGLIADEDAERVVGIAIDDLHSLHVALLVGTGVDSVHGLIRVRTGPNGALVFLSPTAVELLAQRTTDQDWHLRDDRIHVGGDDSRPVW